jgi:hypothetical protein
VQKYIYLNILAFHVTALIWITSVRHPIPYWAFQQHLPTMNLCIFTRFMVYFTGASTVEEFVKDDRCCAFP